jgi:uncharacterized protein YjbI with pentapeptide repeats
MANKARTVYLSNAAGDKLVSLETTITDSNKLRVKLLEKAIKDGASLAHLELAHTVFSPLTEIEGMDFSHATFYRCDFSSVSFLNCKFVGTRFNSCRFGNDADNSDAHFVGSNLEAAFFNIAEGEVCFDRCDFSRVEVRRSRYAGFAFYECNLTDAVFSEAVIKCVEECALENVRFFGAGFKYEWFRGFSTYGKHTLVKLVASVTRSDALTIFGFLTQSNHLFIMAGCKAHFGKGAAEKYIKDNYRPEQQKESKDILAFIVKRYNDCKYATVKKTPKNVATQTNQPQGE